MGPGFWNLSLGAGSLGFKRTLASTRSIYGASNPGPTLCGERSRSGGIFQEVFLRSNRTLSGQKPARNGPADARQVGFRWPGGRQPCRRHQSLDIAALAVPDLHYEGAARRQQPRWLAGRSGDRRRGRRTRHPARDADRDRAPRHPAIGDVRRADIGRIRHQQVEWPRQRRGIVAGDECRARRESQLNWALSRAVRSAATLMSVPTPNAFGNSDNSASRIAPEPVPRSAMRSGESRLDPARKISSAASTTVSVSGRGTSVAGESRSGKPQNSLRPRIRATGSPAMRRFAKPSRRSASSSVRIRADAAIKPVRSRPSTEPTRIRASSSAESRLALLELRRQCAARSLNRLSSECFASVHAASLSAASCAA